jgi:hypothetical protein
MAIAAPPPMSPPARIAVEQLGKPTFQDDFARLDAGPDLAGSTPKHRWRTVLGSGGPLSVSNRSFGGDVVFVDPDFAGVDASGRPGGSALRLQPLSILEAGGLDITAARTSPRNADLLWRKGWYSGLLSTKLSYSQDYGYWEVTADLPICTRGAWSGIWLLPVVGQWPNGGEIDGPEAIGNGRLYYSLHSSVEKPAPKAWAPPTGCGRGFHRYGILSSKSYVAFYYDGQLQSSSTPPADFGRPMYLIIDLAMGGAWAGPPDSALQSEHLTVKSVNAWKGKP